MFSVKYSPGVLNPLELAIVNNGLKKSESHLLPVMEDEVWRSMETNSTLENEGSSLTRLEMDLFEDIRQSIPKPITSRFELGRPGLESIMQLLSKFLFFLKLSSLLP